MVKRIHNRPRISNLFTPYTYKSPNWVCTRRCTLAHTRGKCALKHLCNLALTRGCPTPWHDGTLVHTHTRSKAYAHTHKHMKRGGGRVSERLARDRAQAGCCPGGVRLTVCQPRARCLRAGVRLQRSAPAPLSPPSPHSAHFQCNPTALQTATRLLPTPHNKYNLTYARS